MSIGMSNGRSDVTMVDNVTGAADAAMAGDRQWRWLLYLFILENPLLCRGTGSI